MGETYRATSSFVGKTRDLSVYIADTESRKK